MIKHIHLEKKYTNIRVFHCIGHVLCNISTHKYLSIVNRYGAVMVIRIPQIHLTSVAFKVYDRVPFKVFRLLLAVEGNILAVMKRNVIFDIMDVANTSIKRREENIILLIRKQAFQHSIEELDTLSSEVTRKTSQDLTSDLKH